MEFLNVVTSRLSPGFARVFSAELDSCDEVYGFFPCSTSVGGNLFLLILYVVVLLKAAGYLSAGSELLLTVLNPGLIGGLVLPILSSLPDAMLVLMSGISGSAEDAQSEVLVGMGLLAGSNILVLTLFWGSALLVGRNDLIRQGPNGKWVAKDKTLTKGWSLTQTGVTTDNQTRVASWIMMVTVLPYLVAQMPVVFGWSGATGSESVLLGFIICLLGLASYCMYQVSFPWIQQRWIYRARLKVRQSSALQKMSLLAHGKQWGSLIERDGKTPNRPVLGKLFEHFDSNSDEQLSRSELASLITGLGIEHSGKFPDEQELTSWLNEFDFDNDRTISKEEFIQGMVRWIRDYVRPSKARQRSPTSRRNVEADAGNDLPGADRDQGAHWFWALHSDQAQTSLTALLQDQAWEDEEDEKEAMANPPTKAQVVAKAVALLVVGTVIAGIVADPLVSAVGNFSTVTGISSFFISFVATPLATSSGEAIASLTFASRRKKKNISLTYSQIYGGITMNNTLCLAVFLAIVYFRGLTWDFTSEVSVVLLATVVIGSLASFRVTFPTWMAFIALLLYPLSIALISLLQYFFHTT